MPITTPRLEIYPHRIEANGKALINLCHSHHIQVATVCKSLMAHPAVVSAMVSGGADMMADSRILNLRNMADLKLKTPTLLLRLPAPSQALDVVRWTDYSLNSSSQMVKLLSEAAQSLKVRHKIIIMVDLGDLREGVWPDRVEQVVKESNGLPYIDLIGIGANLACYGGVIPSTENMHRLVEIRDQCRRITGLELDIISGGNSANIPLLMAGGMPPEVNHLRIGEAILLGRNVIDRNPMPGTRQDTLKIIAEVIEVECKPSLPIGQQGQNAFGETREFVDRGLRKRAICNIGRQDIVIEGLTPEDPGIIVLGGSSDHLILDIEGANRELHLGDEVAFSPNYSALLAASTSVFVQKSVIIE